MHYPWLYFAWKTNKGAEYRISLESHGFHLDVLGVLQHHMLHTHDHMYIAKLNVVIIQIRKQSLRP